MKKYLYLLVLPFIATVLGGCNDDDDVMDTRLIKGQWELVSEDHSDYTYIYDFGTRGENTWSWGTLTTYYLTYGGDPVHDKVYSWHVSDPANYDQVYLDLTLIGELDSDDAWENTDYYIVERLTATEMILRKDEVGDTQTRIRFIRRNDLTQP